MLSCPMLALSRAACCWVALLALASAQPCGDCNGDGSTNILDALVAARAGAGIVVVPPALLPFCDVNATTVADVIDALLIAQFAAGLGWTVPVCPPPPPPDWRLQVPYDTPHHGIHTWPPLPMAYDTARNVLVAYGFGLGGDETWEFDGVDWNFIPTPIRPSLVVFAIFGFGMRMVFDEARGVCVLASPDPGFTDLETWEWDGLSWVMRPGATLPVRFDYGMAYDSARGRTVLFGGDFTGVVDETWEYDGNVWTQVVVAGPSARNWIELAFDSGRGVTVLFGGDIGGGMLDDTWEYDGVAWTQRLPAMRPSARRACGLAYDAARGVTVLFGGLLPSGTFASDTWEWNGTNWAQRTPATPLEPQIAIHMFFDPVGARVLMQTSFSHLAGRLFAFDGLDWSMAWESPLPVGDLGTMAFFPPRGTSILLDSGGIDCAPAETWEYDGLTWSRLSISTPTPRWLAPLSFFPSTGNLVLFGGRDPCPGAPADVLGETWEYDGSVWTQAFPAMSPAPRFEHAMTYDAARDEIVLFGGTASTTGGILSPADTWVWNGGDWTEKFPATSPPARSAPSMSFDPDRSVVVLFGGDIYFATFQNDTWEWDGATWTQIPTATVPPEIAGASMVWHAGRQRTVMHGGAFLTPGRSVFDINETWEYDGVDWLRILTPTTTPLIGGLDHSGADAFTYDPLRAVLVFHRFGTWEYR